MDAREVKEWLDALVERAGDSATVAIDDDGQRLVSLTDGEPDGGWLEIGGLPEGVEYDPTAVDDDDDKS